MISRISILFSFTLLSYYLQGQNIRFYAATDASVSDPAKREYQVLQNSVFEVSFTLENATGTGFSSPSFNGLQVIQGPSTSSQISIINGRKSEKKSYTYRLIGTSEGTYTIGIASISTSQGKLTSDPFTIVVRKSTGTGEGTLSYIETVVSDSTAYIGQQIIVKYQLVTQENIKSYEAISNFEFDGFFVRELDDVSRRPVRIIRDGQEYFSTTLEAVSLFPQQTGTYTIPAIAIRVGIPKPSRRRSLFSFQEYDYKVLNSQPIQISVEDLPLGAPLSFSGAVGHYTASFETDKKSLTTDQSLNLKLSIRGDGDNKNTIPPIMDLGEEFEVYDPNSLRDESYVSGAKVVNYKVFEYLIVPENPGQYTINPEFSYFNIDSNRYETINPPIPFRINVTKGQNTTADITSISNRNVRPNKPASISSRSQWGFMGSVAHLSILSILFLGILGMTTHQYLLRRESNLDPALKAKRKARKVAIKRLEGAKTFMEANDKRSFYDEIAKTILHYLEDKLNISTGSLTMENLNEEIKQQGLKSDTIENVSSLLKSTELALFAGASTENLENTYLQAQSIIEDIEASN